MFKKVVSIMVLSVILLSGQLGWCDTQTGEQEVYAVQNRIFHRTHEIDLSIGYIADDAFYQVYPISLGYTYHLTEKLGWEVGRFQYMINTERNLKEDLEDQFNVTPERFPEPIYMFHSHLVYKPLYGKHAWLNKSVINNEIYLLAGGGVAYYEWEESYGEGKDETAFSLSLGAGLRYFLNKKFCLNFEIRHLSNFREDETETNLYFGGGLGYRFNLAPRKVEEDPSMKKLKRILDEN